MISMKGHGRRKRCLACKSLKSREELDINDVCKPCMAAYDRACRGCRKDANGYQYCDECAANGLANCPHGRKPGECGACDFAADAAFDAARG